VVPPKFAGNPRALVAPITEGTRAGLLPGPCSKQAPGSAGPLPGDLPDGLTEAYTSRSLSALARRPY